MSSRDEDEDAQLFLKVERLADSADRLLIRTRGSLPGDVEKLLDRVCDGTVDCVAVNGREADRILLRDRASLPSEVVKLLEKVAELSA